PPTPRLCTIRTGGLGTTSAAAAADKPLQACRTYGLASDYIVKPVHSLISFALMIASNMNPESVLRVGKVFKTSYGGDGVDFIDQLNYQFTSGILVIFIAVIGVRQYVGESPTFERAKPPPKSQVPDLEPEMILAIDSD
ncbi:hypothetical protein Ciccas_008180, partial [Cichlidogyrus casuarinus]